MAERKFHSLQEFYPFYLSEHGKPSTRAFHFLGTGLVILCFFYAILTQHWWFLVLIPVLGYGFAWISHVFIERNKPATFTYPGYSLVSDFIMFWDILTGRINKRLQKARMLFPGEIEQ